MFESWLLLQLQRSAPWYTKYFARSNGATVLTFSSQFSSHSGFTLLTVRLPHGLREKHLRVRLPNFSPDIAQTHAVSPRVQLFERAVPHETGWRVCERGTVPPQVFAIPQTLFLFLVVRIIVRDPPIVVRLLRISPCLHQHPHTRYPIHLVRHPIII